MNLNARPQERRPAKKTKLDSFCTQLQDIGWSPGLTPASYESILGSGLRGKNLILAAVASEIALNQHPLILRGLFYQVVSAGLLPSTDKKHSARLGRVMTRLREAGVVPFSWIVDNLRSTDKPSSWSGLNDFVETVRNSYRMDFWASLDEYVHFIVEKDAMAGTIAPVTREFDVALSPIRGYCSLSFAHSLAEQWKKIHKPIHVYYLGDYDPSGFDLERDIRQKLHRYCGGADVDDVFSAFLDPPFEWTRLAVNHDDFEQFNLLPLKVKLTDNRAKKFIQQHGTACAELDAIPANELRRRVREAITEHIPQDHWERLQQVEKAERESWGNLLNQLPKGA